MDETKDILTFAIPFYKNKVFLEKAIQSVLGQTSSNWRLIVVNDCSPENGVAEIVSQFKDERIFYVQNVKNLGLAGNWNRCLSLAMTRLVTILHNDDELLPGYADLMLARFRKHPEVAAIFCQAKVIDRSGKPIFSFPDFIKLLIQPSIRTEYNIISGDVGMASLLRGNYIYCPTLCYNKDRIDNILFDVRWRFMTDMDFIFRLLKMEESIIALPETAYCYRRHDSNETVLLTRDLKRFEEELQFYDELKSDCLKRGWVKSAKIASNKTIIKMNLFYCVLMDMFNFRGRAARKKAAFLLGVLTRP